MVETFIAFFVTYSNAEKPSTGWTSQTTRFVQAYSEECQENEKFVFITVDEMTSKYIQISFVKLLNIHMNQRHV